MEISSFISACSALERAKEQAIQKIKIKDKIQAIRRVEPLKLPKSETKNSIRPHIKNHLKNGIKNHHIKARITSIKDTGGTACFYTDDLDDSSQFHEVLSKRCKSHIKYLQSQGLTNVNEIYKLPYTHSEFKYQTPKSAVLYYDNQDNIVLPEKCIDELCIMELCISPYDFMNGDKHLVGCNVRVKKIKMI